MELDHVRRVGGGPISTSALLFDLAARYVCVSYCFCRGRVCSHHVDARARASGTTQRDTTTLCVLVCVSVCVCVRACVFPCVCMTPVEDLVLVSCLVVLCHTIHTQTHSRFSPSHRHLFTAAGSAVCVHSVETGATVRRLEGHAATVTAIKLNPENRLQVFTCPMNFHSTPTAIALAAVPT